MALNGYTDTSTILDKFSEDCFGIKDFQNKEAILNFVCRNAIAKYDLSPSFLEHIKDREGIESTYFGNAVAMPHPLSPITNETFVSVAIAKKPVEWDYTHQVQLVMLISIEKDNPKAYQLWYYLSDLIRNSDVIQELTSSKSFEEFIETLGNTISI